MSFKLDHLFICKRCGQTMRETADTIQGKDFYIYKCDHCFLGLEVENNDRWNWFDLALGFADESHPFTSDQ